MNTSHLRVLAVLTTIIAAYGCTDKAVIPPPSSASNKQTNPGDSAKPDDATRGTISVSQDIRVACGLSDDDAHFTFDSAHVIESDRRMLRTLADCFVSGPLQGRKMSLVGHADPRGTEEYNLALAGRRADTVKGIMVDETMVDAKISTTSRGAMDATGTDETSWAGDRRVDVYLGN